MKNFLCSALMVTCTFLAFSLTNIGIVNGQEFELSIPSGIPLTGNIYLTSVCQILILDTNGNYLRRIGSCGNEDAQFYRPQGILLDTQRILVSDSGNSRIQILDRNGNYLSEFGSYGSGDGQFYEPVGIAVDLSGNIYVADRRNNRIQKFDSEGVFLSKFGNVGFGNGQFNFPTGLAVVGSNLFVADMINARVQKFDLDGNYIGQVNEFSLPTALLAYHDGLKDYILVGDILQGRITIFNAASGTLLSGVLGDRGTGNGKFNSPTGIAVDTAGNIFVADNANNNIQKFEIDIAFDMDLNSGSFTWLFLNHFGISGNGNAQFHHPVGVAADHSGSIYVADSLNDRIQKFDSNGTYLSQFGNSGFNQGEFRLPYGVAVDNSNRVYVTELGNARVQVFDSNGNFIRDFGSPGDGDGQFTYPAGIAVASDGSVYVSDSLNSRVEKFDASSVYLGQLGSSGTGEG